VLRYIMEETKLFRKGRFIYADQHPHISSNFRTAWCNFNSFDFLCTSSCTGASFEICKSISKFIVTSWFIPRAHDTHWPIRWRGWIERAYRQLESTS